MGSQRRTTQRITIKTVAADAGVSVSAVSKVLRNAYGVSDELRGKVNESIQKLGYRPSAAARGMRGKSHTVGVLMVNARNTFFADLLEGMNTAFQASEYQPLIGISQHSSAIEAELVEAMIDRQMDGIIMVGPQLPPSLADANRPVPASLKSTASRIPTVVIAHYEDSPLFDTVNNDDLTGAKLAVTHLIEQGCNRIAYLSPELVQQHAMGVAAQRHRGYEAAMNAAGLSRQKRVVTIPELGEKLQETVENLFNGASAPDGIFCWSDVTAFEVISAIRGMGLAIPEDVAIVGYDNTRACDYFQNALSSVDQAGQALGVQAARLLLERIHGRTKSEHFSLAPRLVVRRSSQRLREAP